MTTLDSRPGVAFRKERVALALLLVAVALALVAERWSARERTVEAEAERLSGQASAARGVLAQQLQGVRSALLVLADDRADAPRLRAFARAVPGVTELMRLDADGRVVASSDPGTTGFPRLVPPADPRPGTLYLLAPAADAAGRWRMPMLLPAGDGGWLAASFDADYARVVQRSVRYAADMRTALVHGGGRVVMAEPAMRDIRSIDLVGSDSGVAAHLASGRESSVVSEPSVVTGEPRLFVMLSLRAPQVPVDGVLVMTVSRARSEVLAGWRQQAVVNAGLFLLTVVLSSTGMALMHRRQRAALERERLEAERLRLVAQGADLVIWDIDFASDRVSVNRRWNELIGLDPDSHEHHTREWLQRVHPGAVRQR